MGGKSARFASLFEVNIGRCHIHLFQRIVVLEEESLKIIKIWNSDPQRGMDISGAFMHKKMA